jgi:hypothetical protein
VEKQFTDAKKGLQEFSWIVTSGNSSPDLDSLLAFATSISQNFIEFPPLLFNENT